MSASTKQEEKPKIQYHIEDSFDIKVTKFIIGIITFIVRGLAWGALPFLRFHFGERAFGWIFIVIFGVVLNDIFGLSSPFVVAYMLVSVLHGLHIIYRRVFNDKPWHSYHEGISFIYLILESLVSRFNLRQKTREILANQQLRHAFDRYSLEGFCCMFLDPLIFFLVVSLIFNLSNDNLVYYIMVSISVGLFVYELILSFNDRMFILDNRDSMIMANAVASIMVGEEKGANVMQSQGVRKSTQQILAVSNYTANVDSVKKEQPIDDELEALRGQQKL